MRKFLCFKFQVNLSHEMNRLMRKPTICICENKGADQLRGNREADHAFVFATRIVHFLFFLNPKFQASSLLLCLYSSVCIGPVWKPHCWFSHEAAQMCFLFCHSEKLRSLSDYWSWYQYYMHNSMEFESIFYNYQILKSLLLNGTKE